LRTGPIGRRELIGVTVQRGENWFAAVSEGGDRPVLVLSGPR
jgi:hypothetical protein